MVLAYGAAQRAAAATSSERASPRVKRKARQDRDKGKDHPSTIEYVRKDMENNAQLQIVNNCQYLLQ
eukprot:5827425-Amphidinium_carterae.1